MEGKINEKGFLEIKRAGKFKKQECPRRATEDAWSGCGDWCPLFREPCCDVRKERSYAAGSEGFCFVETGRILLETCQVHVLIFDKFTDERK